VRAILRLLPLHPDAVLDPTVMPQWLIDWLHSFTLYDLLVWVVILVAVVFFFRKGWPWLKRFAAAVLGFAKVLDAVQDLPAFIKRTDRTLAAQDLKIEDVHHETQNNDGSSIKDSQDRTEALVRDNVLPILTTLTTGYTDLRAEVESLRAAKTVTSVEVTTQKEHHA
jgi:hypothetical protein